MPSLYTPSQSNYIKENLDNLIKEAAKAKLKELEPTMTEFKSVMKIIKSYIRKKKRIIYGGYATNSLLKVKNKKDVIYDEEVDTPDIEFYTPEPVKDLVEICNELEDAKFKHVTGKSAQHPETYSIFVNFENYCDISYVPTIVYNNMQTIKIENMLMIHPKYEIINWYRQFTDPMTAHWRWDKQFKRMERIQKHYPFPNKDGPIQFKVEMEHKAAIKETLEKFVLKKDSLIIFNYFAYNYFISVSKYKTNKIKEIDVPYLDFISVNYIDDCIDLYNHLKKIYKDDIQVEEYYPFFQFYGYKTTFLYKGKEFINIYHHNYKCIPYKKISSGPNKYNGYMVGTYPFVMMMLLILQEKTKIDKHWKTNKSYHTMFSNILKIRNFYLNKHNKTVLDDTPFQEFQVACVGTTLTQNRLFRLEIERKRKQGKRFSFYYHPSENRDKIDTSAFTYNNTSGNIIRNDKNKKIFKTCKIPRQRTRSKESKISRKNKKKKEIELL